RHGQHPRRDPLPAHPGKCGLLVARSHSCRERPPWHSAREPIWVWVPVSTSASTTLYYVLCTESLVSTLLRFCPVGIASCCDAYSPAWPSLPLASSAWPWART